MKKIFKKLKKIAQVLTNILITVILLLFYIVFITPFGICIRLFKDYLGIKSDPEWQIHKNPLNISEFLKEQ